MPTTSRPVAVVTDSTAGLPSELIDTHDLTVVPLTVTIDSASGREGVDVSPEDVAKALVARHTSVTTSRPSPADFSTAYGRLLDQGAPGVVSVHLSGKLSGTCESARLAAAGYPGRVEVVDSCSTGMGLGFCAVAASGFSDRAAAVSAARAAAARTTTLFYVDTLEYLRRGGRIGAASALLGTALSVKPILRMVDGEIVVQEKVRTASRALARLVDLAVEAAGGDEVEVGVHHLAAPDRAAELAVQLGSRLGDRLRACYQTEIGAAVGAHVGPGLASVVVHSRSTA
ncbi:MAG: DegV family protein [Actinobacteria bacterium]|nr:MAG: DegV family protein [Actinomycetota bacterium]